jgi:LPXTG-motif cell wall-anchored protein
MCGCSANFNGDERDVITQDEFNRGFDFTGNRPSMIEAGDDNSFDFTGNRPSMIEAGDDNSFDFVNDLDGNTEFDSFLGKKAKARRQERKATRKGLKSGETTPTDTDAGTDPTTKNQYESSSWFGNNWIYIVLGVAVIGGGYWYYKKRK